jgi:hypothetical protein
MMFGIGSISLSSAGGEEQSQWQNAARRECDRYHLAPDFVAARMQGGQLAGEEKPRRSWLDLGLVATATLVFLLLAAIARLPQIPIHGLAAAALSLATLLLLLFAGLILGRTTGFY